MLASINPQLALAQIWHLGGLHTDALGFANLTGADPVLPSSFAVGTAAQTSIAAAAMAACEVGVLRGQSRQQVAVDMAHASIECTAWFSLNGKVAEIWDKFSGLYRCQDGWVRIHANFAHHREGALRLLGLDPSTATREEAESCLLRLRAHAFEDAAAQQGLVVAAFRSFDEWDAHAQGLAVAAQPLMTFEKMGNAPPLPLTKLSALERPLSGVRVLDLTRILAGPVCGRTLAAYGADVMLVNSPNLPNIDSIADTSRGKLSCHIDLRSHEGQAALQHLAAQANVFVQGYRPQGVAALGFGPEALAQARPGIVYVSLSAYGELGPWAQRRGFDSLVQTATGFNHAEMQAGGGGIPKALPLQILDYATGHLMAFAAAAAIAKQQQEGGSWHVRLSLAQTGHWLRALGRVANGLAAQAPKRTAWLCSEPSGFGELTAITHSAGLAKTPAAHARPSMPPGSHPPQWP